MKTISLDQDDDNDESTAEREDPETTAEEIEENSFDEDIEIGTSTCQDPDPAENAEETSENNLPELQRPTRTKKIPEKLKDYQLNLDDIDESAFLSYKEAISSEEKEEWLKAIEEEKRSLKINKTWIFVDKKEAEGHKILTNKWVLRKKNDGKFKARLVVRGCEQTYGQDFEETYSPVIGADSLRLLMAIAVKKGFKFKTFDVKTAFLYSDLQENIFMKVPEGYKNGDTKVCKLKKSLYGLKQSSLNWNNRLTNFLKNK
ncbi:unnamed protein product, partial [Nesidiocoris tenuis]